MSLKNKAINGIIWTVIDTFILKGLTFIATLILARWLGPTDFGLIGMITVFIAIGNSISDSGLSSSLIRTKNADEKDFSTVFILNLGLGIFMFFLLFFTAPLIANFFKQDILINIIRVYCLSFIISGFSAVQLARLNATMQFKKIAKYNIPGIVISCIIGLLLGYLGYGVWALVWMTLSNQLIKTVVLWSSSKWMPKFIFSLEKANYHYTFGYRLMISGLLNTIFLYIYNIVIGKIYTVKDLGFYERSKSLNDYPVTTITGVISRVTYPLLVSVSDDKEKLGSVYKKILGITFFITAPLMFGLSAIAHPLFNLILGIKWLEAVPYFQILCFAGMFYPIHAFNLNVFQVFGRSDLFLKLEIIKKGIVLIAVFIGIQFGIYGLLWSSVLTSVLALFVNTHYSKDLINYKTLDQLKDLLPTYVISLIMFFLINYLLILFDHYNSIIQIIIASVFGLSYYVLVNFLLKNNSFIFITKLIKEKFIKL